MKEIKEKITACFRIEKDIYEEWKKVAMSLGYMNMSRFYRDIIKEFVVNQELKNEN